MKKCKVFFKCFLSLLIFLLFVKIIGKCDSYKLDQSDPKIMIKKVKIKETDKEEYWKVSKYKIDTVEIDTVKKRKKESVLP